MARGRAAATKPMEKLSDDFNKKVLKATDAERRGKSKEKYSKQKGNIIRNRAGRRDQETERGYIQDGYDNSTPLDYSKIKHKTPINTRPKKKLTKGDEMEAAYDNFEKIMGAGNINSLGETTKGLISKQKELLNGIKDMTPVINEAMGVLNKFDLGSILGGIKK